MDQYEPQNRTVSAGGSGGLRVRARGRADTALIERAVANRWPIAEHHRQAVIDRMMDIVESHECSEREVTAAARVIVTADGMNQADEHLERKLAAPSAGTTVNVGVNIQQQNIDIARNVLEDRTYRAYARAAAMGDSEMPDTGCLCEKDAGDAVSDQPAH